MPTTATDWLACESCGRVTEDPYRVSPWNGRTLKHVGYCPCCYEALCARAQREQAAAQELAERVRRGRPLRRRAA